MAWIRIVSRVWIACALSACTTLPGARALQAGNYDQAIQETTAAIESGSVLQTTEAGIFTLRGVAYLFKEQYDLALVDFDRSIELYPSNHSSFSNKGTIYLFTN